MAMTPEFQAFMEEHFSLDNYAGAADFSLEEWYRQFQRRMFIRRLLDETRMPKNLNDIDHHFKEILIDPLVSDFESYWFQWNNNLTPVREWQMTDYFFAKKSVDLAPGKYESFESEYQLLEKDLRKVRRKAFPGQKDKIETIFGLVCLQFKRLHGGKNLYTNAKDDYVPEINWRPDINGADLKVDLHYPDEEIKEAFSNWLATLRTEQWSRKHPKRMFNDSDTKRWLLFKTLPYLDVQIISTYLDCPLNDFEIGYFLYNDLPPGVNPKDKLRAVKKHAEQMSHWPTVQSLGVSSQPDRD